MRAKQQGASIFIIIVFLLLLGQFLFITLKVIPAYFVDMKVANAFESLPSKMDAQIRSGARSLGFKSDVKRYFYTNFRINGVRGVPVEDLQFSKLQNNRVKVILRYNAREHILDNVDAVIRFEHEAIVDRK